MAFTINIYYTGKDGSAKKICGGNGFYRCCRKS